MGSMGADKQWEVLEVGGGFGGMDLLNKLRKFGFKHPLGDAWRCLRCGDYVLGPSS